MLDPTTAAMMLRTLVRVERGRADQLVEVAMQDGALIPTPWTVLRQMASRVQEIADALDPDHADGTSAIEQERAPERGVRLSGDAP